MTRPTHTDLRVLSRRSPGFRRGARERLWYLGAPMRACFLLFVPVVSAACALPPPPDVSPDADPRDAAPGPDAAIDGPPGTYHVGGTVSGMWDGGAVALRLQGPGVDDLETVSANSGFNFDSVLDDGASYSVTVATQPEHHTCAVVDGAGTIAGGDVTTIGIDCEGPAVAVSLSLPYPFAFDPAATSQSLDVSIVAQEVSATVTSVEATAITVGGVPVTSGVPSAPQSLAFGANAHAIRVDADSVSRQWTLDIDRGAAALAQAAYIKASNTDEDDHFGSTVATDGALLVIGAPGEDSSTTGINGLTNEAAADSGAVYVFRRSGSSWTQEAFIKASNTGAGDAFGSAIAISADTLVVGAAQEDGINNATQDAGAVYVFVRSGGLWSQQALLRPAGAAAGDRHGDAVAIDGDLAMVGMPRGLGVGPGKVVAWRRTGTSWVEETVPRGSVWASGDSAGQSVAVDADVLVVGSPNAEGFAEGVALVYRRVGGLWAEEAVLRGDGQSEYFGRSVAIDGETVVIGAPFDARNGRGIDPVSTANDATISGAVYVFRRDGAAWNRDAFIKSSNSDASDMFGWSVSLRGDLLSVAAQAEGGGLGGVDAGQADNTQAGAGAVYLFRRQSTWQQAHYIKASNPENNDHLGGVALSGVGLVGGASDEDSAATGIDGGQSSNATTNSGAAYLFH